MSGTINMSPVQTGDYIELLAFALPMVPVLYFDIRDRRIPDLYLLAAVGALLTVRIVSKTFDYRFLIAAAAAFLVFFLLWLIAGSRMGLGDVKLSASIGFLLGLGGWMLAVFVASLAGTLFILLHSLKHRGSFARSIPFAPYLVGGTLVSFFTWPLLVSRLTERLIL